MKLSEPHESYGAPPNIAHVTVLFVTFAQLGGGARLVPADRIVASIHTDPGEITGIAECNADLLRQPMERWILCVLRRSAGR